jgi:ubiquinone/menaquinone biosynthesis C-methylase UbiE
MTTADLKLWEELYQQNWGSKYPCETIIRFVAKYFYKLNRGNTKLLEIGCGRGSNIWYLTKEGFAAFGIDGSKSAIDIARIKFEDEKLTSDLQVGNIEKLPYEDYFFDGVIENEVLFYNDLNSTRIILGEVNRVLKRDGLFYSRTFSANQYIGKTNTKIAENEFKDISDGPLVGKGFVRLIDYKTIVSLYGSIFKIISIDKLSYTLNNQSETIEEWIIVCQK